MDTRYSRAFADELRAAAGRADLSTAAIAKKLGLSDHWVSRRLRGHVPIDVNELYLLCDAIGVEPSEIFTLAEQGHGGRGITRAAQ